jgi:hypothetical protein
VSVGACGPRAAHASGGGSVGKAHGGMAAEVRPASAGDAQRTSARRRGVLAPDLNCVPGSNFEFENL